MKDITGLIPEFDLISDLDLKRKTLNTWEDAIKLGGWKIADLAMLPHDIDSNSGLTLIDHVRAVTKGCVSMSAVFDEIHSGRISLDTDILIAGALLHEIGKLVHYKKEGGHYVRTRTGSLLRPKHTALELIMRNGLKEEIAHIIAMKDGDDYNLLPEAIILKHVDALDSTSFMKK